MKFYTDVYQKFDKIYVRGYENGKRVEFIEKYKPYLFLNTKDGSGSYRTLEGKTVGKMKFESISDAREFMKSYENVDNMEFYGLTNFQYAFMYDNYEGEIQYDPSIISVVTIDIECAADEGFPNIQKADKEITAITLRKNGKSVVFGCGEFITDDENIKYIRCKDECNLLTNFIKVWNHESFKPDIITGWNIEFFDIPYLVNRIKNMLGENEAKKLSPWRILEERILEYKGSTNQTYNPVGIAVLDYYQLYRKFSFGNQESYKLDYIAQVELGERKLDYSEYGSLLELYKNNFQKFIEYNIYDCTLVEKLEDKLKFIEQVMALAYDGKVNYNDTMATVRPWDVIIHNYLLDRRIVIPQFTPSQQDFELVGGYVKEPKLGLSKWVVSFDLNSLYPHLIMQYNISPETFASRIEFPSIDYMLNGTWEYRDSSVAYAANGCTYYKDKQGFLPALMEKMYNDRVEYKNKMIDAKKEYEKTKDPELIKAIARYHNMQLAKKIQLNSAYGALGNRYFRWFSFNNAEAITTSGQLSIRWIEKKMNAYLNKQLKTDIDYVIASDTDSIYVTLDDLVKKVMPNKSEEEIVKALDEFIEAKIQPHLDKCYLELAEMMNAYQQKMQMKRETIASKGIWKAKKMYILNAWNVEGVQYDKPKLKIQGIEAVRSSTPHACREKLKTAFDIIMNKDELTLQKFVHDFKEEFNYLPFNEVAFPRGIKGMDKYNGKKENSLYLKGTPIQVKGALLFNSLLKENNINFIPPIMNGDKIKFVYLKTPNPSGESVIASSDILPKEFGLDEFIDRDMQFRKSFVEPLKSITEVIDWQVEKIATLEDFF
jgi:DNA polymerase elongation subunit (family B)